MRAPRVRFTVRRLMLAVAVYAASIVLIPTLLGFSKIQAAVLGFGLCLGALFESGGGHWLFFLGAFSGMIAFVGTACLEPPRGHTWGVKLLYILLHAMFGACLGGFLGDQLAHFFPGSPEANPAVAHYTMNRTPADASKAPPGEDGPGG